jgi:pimeloyl-ACP methyl ester carboxylesterase
VNGLGAGEWLAAAALAVGVGSQLLRAGRLALARSVLQPVRRRPRPLPPALAEAARDIEIPVGRSSMRGWLLIPGPRPSGVVVMVHGWGYNGGRMASFAVPLLGNGIACLLLDLRGHGRNPNEPAYSAAHLMDDLRAARDWLDARPELAGLPAGVLGFSFGGLGALVSAARDPRWSAAAALAAPLGPMEATRLYLRSRGLPAELLSRLLRPAFTEVLGVDPETLSGPANLAGLDRPALIVHGHEDEVVPVEQGMGLAAAIPPDRVETLWVEAADHAGILEHEGAIERVAAFFREHLHREAGRVSPAGREAAG